MGYFFKFTLGTRLILFMDIGLERAKIRLVHGSILLTSFVKIGWNLVLKNVLFQF